MVIGNATGHGLIVAHGQSVVAEPIASVGDVTVGDKAGYADVVIRLSAPASSDISIDYVTTDGTAHAASSTQPSADYVGTGGTVVFAPGVTTTTVRVPIASHHGASLALQCYLSIDSSQADTSVGLGKITILTNDSTTQVTGGAGIDTISYAAPSKTTTLLATTAGYLVRDATGVSPDQLLVDVERIHFSDTNVALDIGGDAGQAYRLYQAAFNRIPDLSGLGYHINNLDAGRSLNDVAREFINSPEFKATYGALSNADFVNQLYVNVLHRPGEAAGVAYWIDLLNSGANERSNVLSGFSESPENQLNVIGSIQNGVQYTPWTGG